MLFIISGPTGVGKDSILQQVCKQRKIQRVPSSVTRDRRPGEVGYHYFTKDQFEQKIQAGEFLEYVHVHGKDYWGTLKNDINVAVNSKDAYVKILDVVGYKKIKDLGIDCIGIFIDPPSKAELKRRIIERGESEQSAELRLSRVDYEMSQAYLYNYRVLNEDLDKCINQIISIMDSHL